MKIRLDQYVFEEGYTESRQRAQALIMAGIVYVNNQKVDKAGYMVKDTDKVEVRGKDLKYVSRGGYKLEKAIELYNLDLTDRTCMDIGASTGGFTDCMLQNGAKKVYAVDVGYGQLAWKLRTDERVVNFEKTNIRNVTAEDLEEKINFFSVDVSFISLKHIFPVAYAISTDDVIGACLVKPQFEAGKEKVGKKGVVRDSAVHKEVIINVMDYANQNGFFVKELTFSPIKGPEGNIEFLIVITKNEQDSLIGEEQVDMVVNEAKKHLGE
ncbi:MAG: TlyA family RNA methyltransferase [Oscillospiraceae bacterium]|nr:TlyA family RNA methyltransferase [Oscillospiraceae bacterium]